MKTYIIVLTILTALSSSTKLMAQGNVVVNGGFDTTSGNGAAGWTLSGAAYANVKNGNPPPDVVLGGDQTASQTINSLSPGTIYIVSGDYACYGTDHTTLSFQASVNGVVLFQTAVPDNLGWNRFSFGYTATSSTAVLSLSQIYWAYLSVDDYSIDNIAMYNIPEPSSFWLMGVGGIVSAVFFKNRRK